MHHDEEPELLKDQGHFLVEFGHGEAFASQGKMRRGMSGGPSTCGGGVVGVNAAGSQTQDYSISSRIHLSRLQNMVESTVEWRKSYIPLPPCRVSEEGASHVLLSVGSKLPVRGYP